MKRIVSLFVALCVLCGSLPRIDRASFLAVEETHSPAPGLAPVLFVIGITVAAVGAVAYIWVKLKAPAPTGTYYWALEKSYDHVNWTPVATNAARLLEEKAWDAFEVQRNADGAAFYRMRVVDFIPAGNLVAPSYVICGTQIERPLPQP